MRSRAYVAEVPVKRMLDHVANLRRFNRQHGLLQKVLFLVAAIGFLFILAAVVFLLRKNETIGVPFLFLGWGLAVPSFGFAFYSRRFNFENHRYELLASLLNLLKADMVVDAPASVQLDLRPHQDPNKLHRTGKVNYWDVKFWVDRWLDLRGRFVDGTKYRVTMIERHPYRERMKRSASGRVKRKTKKKSSSEAIVRLKVEGKRYPPLANNANSARKSIKLPAWARLKQLDVQEHTLTLRVAVTPSWSASRANEKGRAKDGTELIAMMFLSLYDLLNRSRALKSTGCSRPGTFGVETCTQNSGRNPGHQITEDITKNDLVFGNLAEMAAKAGNGAQR